MRPNPLTLPVDPQLGEIGVLDDLELVLLRGVEVVCECLWGEPDGFGDQGGEEHGDGAHAGHVVFEGGAEGGEEGGGGPEVGREEVVVEGGGGGGEGVGG